MKKVLKRAIVLAMAGVMTITPVVTVSAETAVVGEAYQMTFPGWYEEPAISHQIVYSTTPIYSVQNDDHISTLMAAEAEDGYEIRQVYVYMTKCDLAPEWLVHAVDDADEKDLVTTPEYNIQAMDAVPHKVAKMASFTVDLDGQRYPHCAIYYGGDTWVDAEGAYGNRLHIAIKVPQGYSCDSYVKLFDSDDNGNRTGRSLDYHFDKSGESAAPATTASASSWKQDAKGWWVENQDGTYLTNQWYESNGAWYYLGADGYMLTNTTTPDGYTVNADGVWVQ